MVVSDWSMVIMAVSKWSLGTMVVNDWSFGIMVVYGDGIVSDTGMTLRRLCTKDRLI